MSIMSFVFISCILSIIAIYLYCQNKNLQKSIQIEEENENKKESLVATIIHDLKTPTNAQIDTLNLLKNEAFGKLNSQQQEMITLTQESCKYMSNLISTILETYSCDAIGIKLNKHNFNIVDLVIELCNTTEILRQKKNQTIKFCNETKNPIVYADELQIRRVILNLLSNAMTYGFTNTLIEITLKNNIDSLIVSVKNTSFQIPQNELSTVFDKYKKTKFSQFNKTGTGLGLYLAKNIVELHKGHIHALSNNDGTCIFWFEIPTCNLIKKVQN